MTKNEKILEKAMLENGNYDFCQVVYGSFSTPQGDYSRGWFSYNHKNGNYEFLGNNVGVALEYITD